MEQSRDSINNPPNTEMGKCRFTFVHMEKDMQVIIITLALLTQKGVTM